jgi:hypothetical protein
MLRIHQIPRHERTVRVPTRLARPLLVVAAALVLGGCAALTVDVDVYKGPLINEEDVQVQELAAMGISAKGSITQAIVDIGKLKDTYRSWRQTEFVATIDFCDELDGDFRSLRSLFEDASEAEISRAREVQISARELAKMAADGSKAKSAQFATKLVQLNQLIDGFNSYASGLGNDASSATSEIGYRLGEVRRVANGPDANLASSLAVESDSLGKVLEGRLPEGIQNQIDDLLKSTIDGQQGSPSTQAISNEARSRLQLSLANFASRLLTVTHYATLKIDHTKGLRGIFGGPGSMEGIEYSLYVMDATGNAILALSDELVYSSQRAVSDANAAAESIKQVDAVFAGTGKYWLHVWLDFANASATEGTDGATWKQLSATIQNLISQQESGGLRVDSSLDAFQALSDSLQKGIASADAGTQASCKAQLALIGRLRPYSLGPEGLVEGYSAGNTPWYVSTSLLSLLTFQKAELNREGSSTANVDSAIGTIELFRARLAKVRPAGAILRTTTPITDLQDNEDDSSPSRQNMLIGLVKEAVPFSDLISDPAHYFENRQKNQISLFLDKVSWQPINHIKVEGAGSTNYVLVKDDLGNWYVKQYVADPEVIFAAASTVLTSQVGGAAGAAASAVKSSTPPSTAAQGTTGAKAPATSSSVSDLVSGDQDDSASEAKSLDSLETALKGLINGTVKQTDNSGKLSKDSSGNPIPVKSSGSAVVYDSGASGRLKDRLDAYDKGAASVAPADRASKLVAAVLPFTGDVALVQGQVAGQSAQAEVNGIVGKYVSDVKATLTARQSTLQTDLLSTIQ